MRSIHEPNIYLLLRHFRHDLLNDLQLLMGHLQLERSNDVLYQDVSNVVYRIQEVSTIFACNDDSLATLVWYWKFAAAEKGIRFSQQVEPVQEPLTKEFLSSLKGIMNTLLTEIASLEEVERFLHMDIASTQLLLETPPLADDAPAVLLAQRECWQVEKTAGVWRYWNVY